jgi:hypothetical protein
MSDTYPDALQIFVPRSHVFWDCNPHYAIVVHGTACCQGMTAQDWAHTFANDEVEQKSSHFIIGKDGTVVQCVSLRDGAGANDTRQRQAGYDTFWDGTPVDNLNLVTVSIEHVKWDDNNADELTPAQKQASFRLIKWLCDTLHIPASHIKTHASIAPKDRADCPGPYPWTELYQFLGEGEDDMLQISDPFAAAHFTQIAPNRWRCVTTNQDVFGGILDFYRRIAGAPRLPLTGEQHDVPDVTYQVFEAGVIVFDPQHKLDHPTGFDPSYLLRLDSELAKKLLH